MKKRILYTAAILLIALSINVTIVFADTVFQPSIWASDKVAISKKAGIISGDFGKIPFNKSITRIDFCELLINTCRIYEVALPELPAMHPFNDTTNINAEYSYKLGLTKGTASGTFSPDMPLSREMAAAMLSRMRMLFKSAVNKSDGTDNSNASDNTDAIKNEAGGALEYSLPMDNNEAKQLLNKYSTDSLLVSEWAMPYMADVYARGILSGTGGGRLDPKSDITREQAAILALNVLTYYDDAKIREAGVNECVLPKPSGIYISSVYNKADLYLYWNPVPSASAYDVTIYKNNAPVHTVRIEGNYIDLRPSSNTVGRTFRSSGISDNISSVYTIFSSGSAVIDAAIKVVPVNSIGDPSMFFLEQKFNVRSYRNINELITGDPQKNQFANINDAKQNMTDIEVKVWNITSTGSKKSSTLNLTVNKNISEDVKRIFEEIYNGEEKFPIKSCIGFSYRDGQSQHSNGTAIDINPNENYFISSKGSILSGSFWKPGKNPYSILPDGDVVRAFNRYGWHWSPDTKWSNGKDYMHFSLNGE